MFKKSAMVGALLLLLAPAAARADWLFTPFAGGTFGGDAKDREHLTYGGSIGWMGAGVIGWEADFGYTPKFFEPKDSPDSDDLTGTNNAFTAMANVIAGVPIGGQVGPGIRPYAVAGVGLLRTNVPSVGDVVDDLGATDFGVNVGGGLNIFLATHVGLRGDVRYFRSLQEEERTGPNVGLGNFDFWRWTVGVTFR